MKYDRFYTDPRDLGLICAVCGDDIEYQYYNVDGEIFCPHCSDAAHEKIIDIHKSDYIFYL